MPGVKVPSHLTVGGEDSSVEGRQGKAGHECGGRELKSTPEGPLAGVSTGKTQISGPLMLEAGGREAEAGCKRGPWTGSGSGTGGGWPEVIWV